MKLRLTHAAAALSAALSAILFLSSCHEDTIIKSSLTPAIDNIHTFGIGPDFNNGTDTITIRTKTVYSDSVVTSARGTGFPIYHALGSVDDPFAGKTTAGIYMQFTPPYTGFTLGSYTLDSLVLVLPYSGFTWGDTLTGKTQNLNVFRISQNFPKDSVFYNFNSLATDGAAVGSSAVKTGPKNIPGSGRIADSVQVRKVNSTQVVNAMPHLRIKIGVKNSDFQNFFQNTALTHVDSVAGFRTAFPGLAIMPDTGSGFGAALPYFILNNAGGTYGTASILAYVHNTQGSSPADTVFQFPYSEANAAHFNRITRNYSGTGADLLSSTSDNAAIAFMQNAPGAAIDVTLPFIQALPQNVVINKAELVFTKIDTIYSVPYFGPARLLPLVVNSSGGISTIADRYPIADATLNFIDGTPRLSTRGSIAVTEYRINIPREVQRAIVQGSNGLHLRIGGTSNFAAAYRTVVAGSGYGIKAFRPSINIIYSKQ